MKSTLSDAPRCACLSRPRGGRRVRTLLTRIIDFAKNKLAPIDLRLTSNPTRTEANAMYQALGFVQRDTNVYMMKL